MEWIQLISKVWIFGQTLIAEEFFMTREFYVFSSQFIMNVLYATSTPSFFHPNLTQVSKYFFHTISTNWPTSMLHLQDKLHSQQPMKCLIYISQSAAYISTCFASIIYPHIHRQSASHIGFLAQNQVKILIVHYIFSFPLIISN